MFEARAVGSSSLSHHRVTRVGLAVAVESVICGLQEPPRPLVDRERVQHVEVYYRGVTALIHERINDGGMWNNYNHWLVAMLEYYVASMLDARRRTARPRAPNSTHEPPRRQRLHDAFVHDVLRSLTSRGRNGSISYVALPQVMPTTDRDRTLSPSDRHAHSRALGQRQREAMHAPGRIAVIAPVDLGARGAVRTLHSLRVRRGCGAPPRRRAAGPSDDAAM